MRTIDTRFFIRHFTADSEEIKTRTRKKLSELEKESAILPTMVIHELYKNMCETLGRETAKTRTSILMNSNFRIVDLDTSIARKAGLLRCQNSKLPTADGIIAATAIMAKSFRVVTDDPHFETINEIKTEWL
jgi:predicted nucleic acid-binding protein